jgi:hypothetical protein
VEELDAVRARGDAAAAASKTREAERVEGVKRLAVNVAQFERQQARRGSIHETKNPKPSNPNLNP